MSSSLRIVFFGTPPFAAQILEALIESGQNIVAVVTRPDKPKGRSAKPSPSAVKTLTQKTWPNLPLIQPEKASAESFAHELAAFEADVFVVVAYGEILKTHLLEMPKKICINVHASLLPKYRGAAPIQRAIMNGEKETGITIMEMALEMDAGDILEVARVPLSEEMVFAQLEQLLCSISVPALLSTLDKVEKNTLKKTPQNHVAATFAPKITHEDRVIDWNKSAKTIHNQVRALSPKPGAFCTVRIGEEEKRLLIKRTRVVEHLEGKPASILAKDKKEWVIGCGQEALSLLEVQLEGKKSVPTDVFLRGLSQPIKIKNKPIELA